MKTLWHFKWTILAFPFAVLGACFYAYYVGFWSDGLSFETKWLLKDPAEWFMGFFSEDIEYYFDNLILSHMVIAAFEVILGYLFYRIWIALTKHRITLPNERQHLIYVCYALFWWPAFMFCIFAFMESGQ